MSSLDRAAAQEIRNAIDAFKKDSASFDDDFDVSYLQRGRNVLADAIHLLQHHVVVRVSSGGAQPEDYQGHSEIR